MSSDFACCVANHVRGAAGVFCWPTCGGRFVLTSGDNFKFSLYVATSFLLFAINRLSEPLLALSAALAELGVFPLRTLRWWSGLRRVRASIDQRVIRAGRAAIGA